MSNIAFLFLPLAFSSLPAVLPFVSPSSQVIAIQFHPNERFGVPGAPAGGGVPAGSHPCWETGYVRLDYLPASITLRIEAWACN